MKAAVGSDAGGHSPYKVLFLAFLAWKVLLVLVAVLSPGIGYDTSTDLLFDHDSAGAVQGSISSYGLMSSFSNHIARKLVRWDAIYFVKLAERGYLYEQEWAFGWGFTQLVGFLSRLLPWSSTALLSESITAILLSNTAHFVSVILLYQFCETIGLQRQVGIKSVIVAALHIIAPAGMFMVAPYAESLFSALSFAAYLSYAKSCDSSAGRRGTTSTLYLVLTGVLVGLSCMMRSNGLFNGLLFVVEVLVSANGMVREGISLKRLQRSAASVIGGCCVAAGSIYPQYIGWIQYCGGGIAPEDRREWCKNFPPSIYTFVQVHNWNNGFLSYWTLSNLPLFMLASPMLYMMFASGIWALGISAIMPQEKRSLPMPGSRFVSSYVLRTMAVPHLTLAILTLTSFHVQIINRISSASPLFYVWLANSMVGDRSKTWPGAKAVVVFMVIYALVQGSLYTNFLPPA